MIESFLKEYFPSKLRPYQLRAIVGLTKHLSPGGPENIPLGGVVHLRTGAGKTNIAAAVAFAEIFYGFQTTRALSDTLAASTTTTQFSPKNIIVLTPTRILTQQQAEVFAKHFSQESIEKLSERYSVNIEINVAVSGTIKPLTSSSLPKLFSNAKHNVQILFSTPGTYIQMLKNTSRPKVTLFPLPESCSTVFFDEVHHCASKHPYASVAKEIMKTNIVKQSQTRMVGLTATLCYARKEHEIKQQIINLFRMLNAPLKERYDATEEELEECGVSKPPTCEELNLYETHGSESTRGLAIRPLKTTNPAEAVDDMHRAFPYLQMEMNKDVEGRLQCKIIDKRCKDLQDEEEEDGFKSHNEIHIYTKRIFLLMRELEKLHPSMDSGRPFMAAVSMQDLLSKAISRMGLSKNEFIVTQNNAQNPRRLPKPQDIWGEVLCVLYQAMRLIIASKQRELELAVRFIHKCQAVFAAAGLSDFLQLIIPLKDPNTQLDVFSDCERVAKSLAALAQVHNDDFRTLIFCEQSLAVAVLADYLTTYFSSMDNDKYIENCEEVGMFGDQRSWEGTDFAFRADWLCSTGNAPSFNIPHRSTTSQESVLEAFREGNFNVMCATTVVEEGLDINTIRFIIHLSPPTNPVAHTQRSGRARDKESQSVVLKQGDGIIVNILRNVANVQTQIACMLAATETASQVPQPLPSRTGLPMPSTDVSLDRAQDTALGNELRKQYANSNPLSALNELSQKIPQTYKPAESWLPTRGNIPTFQCTLHMIFRNAPYQATSGICPSKQAARTEAAATLLKKVLASL